MGTIEQERPQRKEIQPRFRAWMLFDLDGVILRWVHAHTPDASHQAEMLASIQRAKDAGVGIAVLTNRPPGAMPAVAYDLGIDYGIWVTEMGGSLYDVHAHKSMVAPEWIHMAPRVRNLRLYLQDMLGIKEQPQSFDEPQFEPGMGLMKTVLIPPHGISARSYADRDLAQALSNGGFENEFSVNVGKAIDIDPMGLSKAQGMEMLISQNGIDVSHIPTIWIADHDRDIAAGQVLLHRGGMVASVGNANPSYRDFVQSSGGICAPESTSYHSSVTHIVETFLHSL